MEEFTTSSVWTKAIVTCGEKTDFLTEKVKQNKKTVLTVCTWRVSVFFVLRRLISKVLETVDKEMK